MITLIKLLKPFIIMGDWMVLVHNVCDPGQDYNVCDPGLDFSPSQPIYIQITKPVKSLAVEYQQEHFKV